MTLADMSQVFKEKNVRVDTRLPESVSAVNADSDRLVQVLLNLLSNALKFCAAGTGRVEVTLSEAGGVVRVDVRDNGPGIERERPEADLRQVPAGRRHAHRQAARHRTRTAHQPADHRAFRRADVGREPSRRGRVLLVHAAGRAGAGRRPAGMSQELA